MRNGPDCDQCSHEDGDLCDVDILHSLFSICLELSHCGGETSTPRLGITIGR